LSSEFGCALRRLHDATIARNNDRLCNFTESPLPPRERDRVRSLAPAGADVSDRTKLLRAAAQVPSPCPSPSRGEGTLQERLASALPDASLPPARG
jgi:hypothetical protein